MNGAFYNEIKKILTNARNKVYQTVFMKVILHTKIQNKCRYMCVHCQNEGMKELMPVYCVIGKIPAVRNISNKIIVLEKRG